VPDPEEQVQADRAAKELGDVGGSHAHIILICTSDPTGAGRLPIGQIGGSRAAPRRLLAGADHTLCTLCLTRPAQTVRYQR
jgi:hypothetical protein